MQIQLLTPDNRIDGLAPRLKELFRQLTVHREPLDLDKVLAKENNITLLVCREEEKIAGMASLCTYKVISGHKGWIEDVVVDESERGKGIGRLLMNRLIDLAKEKGLSELFLFTGYHRKPAIAMYESLGFKEKESHLYSMDLGKPTDGY